MDIHTHSNIDPNIIGHEIKTNFGFKGDRKYVHGSDIYPAAINIVNEIWGRYPDEVIATFHKFLEKQGVFLLRTIKKGTLSEDIYSRFIFRLGESEFELVLTTTDQQISVTRPYDEEDVLRFSEIDEKSINIPFRNEFSYIEQIIAMTKRLHHAVYPDVRSKWLFTKLQMKDCIDPDKYTGVILEIRAERKLQKILSKCSILVNNYKVGNIFFTAI